MPNWEFIEETMMLSTMRATLSRNSTYNQEVIPSDESKIAMRQLFQDSIRDLLPTYKDPVSDKAHEDNIQRISDSVSKAYCDVLQNGRLRIGTVQKALNLYLKYMWCLEKITTPPHCPFDAVVIGYLKLLKPIQWTKMDSIGDYQMLVAAARTELATHSLSSLADWELKTYADHFTES